MSSDKFSLFGEINSNNTISVTKTPSFIELLQGKKVDSLTSNHDKFKLINDKALFAAIDLGTNNCRLMIAQSNENGTIDIQSTFSRLVRLGEGLQETGKLSDKAMQRTIDTLHACVKRISYYEILQIRCIATAACRTASNGNEFLSRVFHETGLKFDILTTKQEAYYAALSCAPLVPAETKHTIVLDIGGGSTEIVGLKREGDNLQIQAWHSLPLGVVTLSEKYEYTSIEKHYDSIKNYVAGFMNIEMFQEDAWQLPLEIIGTSGTVTMLAGIYLDLPRYSKRRVDGYEFKTHHVRALIQNLRNMSWQERAEIGCIGSQRVDLILSGCAILEVILDHFNTTIIRVADRGLREGVLHEMMYRLALTQKA